MFKSQDFLKKPALSFNEGLRFKAAYIYDTMEGAFPEQIIDFFIKYPDFLGVKILLLYFIVTVIFLYVLLCFLLSNYTPWY
uniref:Uncharacterized protein n=1 Tax=Pararge aegeria TaxID=116150 RepID=S4PZZ1_9NEOP